MQERNTQFEVDGVDQAQEMLTLLDHITASCEAREGETVYYVVSVQAEALIAYRFGYKVER